MKNSLTDKGPSRAASIIMLGAMLTAAVVRWRLLGLPFERDEGEYAYMGSLVLKGLLPYKYAYSMKLPGIYAAYAVIMKFFGQTRAGVHGGLLLMNAATSVLVYLLGRRLFGTRAGLAAGAAFAVISLNTHLHGIIANSEHFVIFFALAGLCVLVRAADEGRAPWEYFIAGLLLGAGIMMKQHGVFFLLLGPVYVFALYLVSRKGPLSVPLLRSVLVLAGGVTPFAAACVFFYLAGGFEKFWFWTVSYSRLYVSSPPLRIGLLAFERKFTPILLTGLAFWVFAALGAVLLRGARTGADKKIFAALFMVFSVLAIMPGLYFREHYFILTLPAASLLAGLGADRLAGLSAVGRRAAPTAALLTLVITVPGLLAEGGTLFVRPPEVVSRQIFGTNPFPESVRVAAYIRENSEEDDTVAVLGSEPQIFFYSGRASATPFIYTYPLMEYQPMALEMQKEMIGDIQEKRPRFIVYVDIYNSWLRGRRSVGLIFDWFRFYWPGRYEVAGIVEIGPGGTTYLFGEAARGRATNSPSSIIIYRRI
jgi:hypothetical protein